MKVPYVAYVTLNTDRALDPGSFPGTLLFTRDLHLDIDSPVTFFVGENGSGKSTLLEAMAVLARLPISGGGMNETGANHAFAEESILAGSLRLAFIKQPKDRYSFEPRRRHISRRYLSNDGMTRALLATPSGGTAAARFIKCLTARRSCRSCRTGSIRDYSSWTSRSRRSRRSDN